MTNDLFDDLKHKIPQLIKVDTPISMFPTRCVDDNTLFINGPNGKVMFKKDRDQYTILDELNDISTFSDFDQAASALKSILVDSRDQDDDEDEDDQG